MINTIWHLTIKACVQWRKILFAITPVTVLYNNDYSITRSHSGTRCGTPPSNKFLRCLEIFLVINFLGCMYTDKMFLLKFLMCNLNLIVRVLTGTHFWGFFAAWDVWFLVLSVRFRKRSCHLSASPDSQHSNKKVLMSWLWCSALSGISSSVIGNHCPEYRLTGRKELKISSAKTYFRPPAIHSEPLGFREQIRFDDLHSKFKLRPLPLIIEWQLVMKGIKSNEMARWRIPQAKRPLVRGGVLEFQSKKIKAIIAA